MERIWATGDSSFGFVGGTKSASTEVLLEESILLLHLGVVDFHFGPSIFAVYTNGPNQLARRVAADPYLQKWKCEKHHRREAEKPLAAGDPHGRSKTHINLEPFDLNFATNENQKRRMKLLTCFSECLGYIMKREWSKRSQLTASYIERERQRCDLRARPTRFLDKHVHTR